MIWLNPIPSGGLWRTLLYLLLFVTTSGMSISATNRKRSLQQNNRDSYAPIRNVFQVTYYLPILLIAALFFSIMIGFNYASFTIRIHKEIILIALYNLILLLLTPLLRKRFDAISCACFWLLPNIWVMCDLMLSDDLFLPCAILLTGPVQFGIPYIVWGIGAFAVQIGIWISDRVFRWHVLRHASPVDHSSFELYLQIRSYYFRGQTIPPTPVVSDRVRSPLTMGISYKSAQIVLPPREYSAEELALIYRHELTHLFNHDNNAKMYLLFLCSILWFLPPVWIGMRRSAEDLELSCDEQTTQSLSEEKKHKYAKLVLTAAGPAIGFTTCLSASAKNLRYRLKCILHPEKRRSGVVLACVLSLLFAISTYLFAVAPEAGTFQSLVFWPAEEINTASDTSETFPLLQDYLSNKRLYMIDTQLSDIKNDCELSVRIEFSQSSNISYILYFRDHYVQIDKYLEFSGSSSRLDKSDIYLTDDSLDLEVLKTLIAADST